ncbi:MULTISPECIES: ATP-binding protein [unclassified Leptolyngbya]|uniref:ATP-binding protein n=1 Tax=unclassified Leptolyngbya TaxID=2650499 RepID=UPI001684208A|nr:MULTISPECIES: ATP-binding protein [unclassified Leptolyngbya]MBD1909260.1 GAF domain-containing protein [Leptolyngbya sp. FACHB-8]MBD2154313.1 GAF domain-containing protein [Leptolyngbya sp. FACHB-16]
MSGLESNNTSSHHLREAVEPDPFARSIQPHGVLLVLSDSELVVLQVSANIQEYFGVLPQDLLGQPLTRLLDEAAIALIQQSIKRLKHINFNGFNHLNLCISWHQQVFNGMLHRSSDTSIILELEPASVQAETRSLHPYTYVRGAIARLRQIPDLTEFLQLAAIEVRHITGFDRVMVYQFDAQGAGEVVAEAKHGHLSPYLGLHYPATDIPEPVRELYRRGMVRYIPHLKAQSVELIPNKNPTTEQPIDLSLSLLRSVDTCCVEYHHNMEVAALFVIALTQGETLWGLISCHHQTPKTISYEARESCELLAQLVASELANKVNTEELSYLTKLRSLQSEFVQSISQVDDLRQALVHPAPRLLDLVGAQGAAICLDNEITLVGTTPSLEEVRILIEWAEALPTLQSPLFYTDSLPKLYPEAEAFKDSASGLLLLQISKVRRYTILWFRPEVLKTVTWAGDPHSSLHVTTDGSMTLGPRKSFQQWQQIVQSTSLPWKSSELENALDLRSAIVGIVLKQADELTRMNQELERTIQELDSFAYAASHDLKEPLRGIHNFSNLLLKGYSDVLDETGRSRLQTLVRLTRRMESLIDALLRFSRLGQTELHLHSVDLNQSLHQVLEDFPVSRPELRAAIRIPRPLPKASCDPVLIQEVMTNLISNAIKYNDKPEPWIEIGYIDGKDEWTSRQTTEAPSMHSQSYPVDYSTTFYVRDNGIGIRERHFNSIFRLFKRLHEQNLYGGGTGAGLTIAKKIIERHGGQIWVESSYGEGSTFYFTLQ